MIKINNYNKVLVIICIIGSLVFSINNLIGNDIYRFLVNFSIIPVVLFPILLIKKYKVAIDNNTLFLYYIFVFLAHFLVAAFDLYNRFLYYDKIIHFLSGIFTSFFAIFLLIKFKKFKNNYLGFNSIFIILLTFFVAGFWEIFEYVFDNLFDADSQSVLTRGIHDTMQDMICAFIGSILFVLLYLYEVIQNKDIIIKKYIIGVEKNER